MELYTYTYRQEQRKSTGRGAVKSFNGWKIDFPGKQLYYDEGYYCIKLTTTMTWLCVVSFSLSNIVFRLFFFILCRPFSRLIVFIIRREQRRRINIVNWCIDHGSLLVWETFKLMTIRAGE